MLDVVLFFTFQIDATQAIVDKAVSKWVLLENVFILLSIKFPLSVPLTGLCSANETV
jgi:hypothetical protein